MYIYSLFVVEAKIKLWKFKFNISRVKSQFVSLLHFNVTIICFKNNGKVSRVVYKLKICVSLCKF